MNDPLQAITTAGQHEPAETDNKKDTPKRFTFAWRSKGLGAGAKDIDELITDLEGAADGLRLLKESGVHLDADKSADGDACLVTTDVAVAKKFGFESVLIMTRVANDDVSPGDTISANTGG